LQNDSKSESLMQGGFKVAGEKKSNTSRTAEIKKGEFEIKKNR